MLVSSKILKMFKAAWQSKVVFFGLLCLVLALISACDDDTPPPIDVDEPITFVQPDTTVISAFAGDPVTYELLLVTDRAIDSLIGEVHVDSTGMNYNPATDTTTSFLRTGFADSSNIQEYTGVYQVPGFVESFDVVRLIYTMNAGERTYQKTLRINIK